MIGPLQETMHPDSKLSAIAARLVETINNGTEAEQLVVIKSIVSEVGLRQMPADKYVSMLRRVREQTYGVEIADSNPLRGLLEVRLRSRNGNRWARLYMFSDKVEQEKILEFGFLPLADPLGDVEDPWSDSQNSEENMLAEVRRHLERLARLDALSGVVLIARDGQVLFHESYGMADKTFGVPNKPDTKFNLGSMNKMFTGVAVAQLVSSGKLAFTDRLIDVLPEYSSDSAAGRITITHLLSHTAGLGMLFERPLYDRQRRYQSHSEIMSVFSASPLLFEPGTRYSYSNEGFIVLGAVIEKVSGVSYWNYIRDHIFKPAEMHSTGSYALDEVTPNVAVGYMRYEDDPFGMEPRRPNWMFLGWRGNACGGGYSTAGDLLRFSQALRRYRLLESELTEKITSRQVPTASYGYGFRVESVRGKSVRGHSGGGPNSGVNSDLGVLWDQGYTVVVLSNYDAPFAQDLRQKICGLLAGQDS